MMSLVALDKYMSNQSLITV